MVKLVCAFLQRCIANVWKSVCSSAFLIQTEVITVKLNITVTLMLLGPSKKLSLKIRIRFLFMYYTSVTCFLFNIILAVLQHVWGRLDAYVIYMIGLLKTIMKNGCHHHRYLYEKWFLDNWIMCLLMSWIWSYSALARSV
jgi:hypothetical protein